MNIKKALKEKNRLVKEILDLHTRVATYNSVEVGHRLLSHGFVNYTLGYSR